MDRILLVRLSNCDEQTKQTCSCGEAITYSPWAFELFCGKNDLCGESHVLCAKPRALHAALELDIDVMAPGVGNGAVTRPEPRIDFEIQLLRLVQLALAGAKIVTQRSEEVRHQGSGLMSIGGIRLAELGTHPLFLHAELDPEREEDENENDEPAHLGDGNRHAKQPPNLSP